jgi:succinyl-diaminopimelate desuccinylase
MCSEIFSFIDNGASLAIELQTELCKRPAVAPESGGEGELDKAIWLESWLTKHGFPFTRIDVKDDRAKGKVRPNIIVDVSAACSPGGAAATSTPPRTLWIMAHLDVVPPGEVNLWDTNPWELVRKEEAGGVRLIGRGTEDNQQGLVASLIAAAALKEKGCNPTLPVKLLFCADEEYGNTYGVAALLKERRDLFGKDDLLLVPDGGDKKGECIEIAEKNLLWLEFTTIGKQAHGSRPDLGNNAHLAGAELAVVLNDALGAIFNERDPLFEPDRSTFEPTKKSANVPNINTIPGEDRFCIDMRILPRYSINSVLSAVEEVIKEIEKKRGVTIRYTIVQRVESPATPQDSPLVLMLARAIEAVYGLKARPVGVGGGTVSAFFRNEGIHCAVWSKIDETLHQPNEYALLENILGDAKVMALLMLETP